MKPMRFRLAFTLPSATAATGWSTSVFVHAATLSILLRGWAEMPAELAGPMGQTSLEISVADPSPGSDIDEILPQSTAPIVALERTPDLEPVGIELDTSAIEIEAPEVTPIPELEKTEAGTPSPDGLLSLQSPAELLTEAKEPKDNPSPQEPTSDPLLDDSLAPAPHADEQANTTQLKAGDDTPTSSPPSPGSVGNSKQADATFDRNAPIIYPAAAITAHLEGTVLLRIRIAADGHVAGVDIVESSGHEVLDEAAVKAVRQWHGHAARFGGQSMESVIRLPVKFQLH